MGPTSDHAGRAGASIRGAIRDFMYSAEIGKTRRALATIIKSELRAMGFTAKQISRTKKALKIKSEREPDGEWVWVPPKGEVIDMDDPLVLMRFEYARLASMTKADRKREYAEHKRELEELKEMKTLHDLQRALPHVTA